MGTNSDRLPLAVGRRGETYTKVWVLASQPRYCFGDAVESIVSRRIALPLGAGGLVRPGRSCALPCLAIFYARMPRDSSPRLNEAVFVLLGAVILATLQDCLR